ncbi:leucine rich repeat protein [Rhizophagus irregularis DAOM 181602=DAOM 197198]|nr:leucine rich repeat protein [Rhizophagus irregularis DAOM 181602=DAOM 197198]
MSYSPQLRLEDYSQYAGVGTIYQNNNVDLIEVDSINNSIGNGVDNNSKLRSQIETHEKVQLVFDESDSNDSNSTNSTNSTNSLSIVSQNDDVNDYKSRIMTTTIVTTTVTSVNSSSKNSVSSHKSAPSLSKFLSFNLKGKFNRSRSPKHVRMLSELKIPVPENNETIIFMSKVKKLDSHTFKKSSNNFIILTKKWLYGFKNIEKASKIFVNSPPPLARDNIDYNSIIISTKNLPSENIVLSLSTVYSVREVSSPEKHIRIDYILGPKNHDHITILSPDIELHHQWLITLKSTIRNADSVGPYLTLNQREWFMKKLKLLDDLADDDENNLVSFRVLLKSSIENDIIKDTNFPVIFILGKNNVYFIPFDLIEIRMAIDSITYWWPNPGYKLKTPKNLQSMILSPERESNKTSEILMGFDRMIEAQCHANKVNRSRINFNVEYVLGSESVMLGLEVNNLPFRFILLPPKDSKSGHNDVYSNQELVTIFNSLIYHPLLHEIILRDINLFELQIQPGPKRHKGRNMLGSVLYDILLSNPRLVKLDLTSCGITSETVSIIGQAFMSGQSCLECLLLSDNPITREGAQALASGLTGHKSAIKELDISNCKLTHDSIEYILHALDTNDPSKLEVLNLSNNMCDLESNILTELLSKTISLRSLNLRNCSKFFIHMITPVISIETLGNTQLTTLNLGGVSLNDHNHINALYAYIQSPAFAKLRFFNIEDCNLGGEMIAIILSYVTTSPNSKKIRVWAGGNHITRTLQGFKELCNAINNNWTPTWLSLRYTMFGSNLEMVNDFLQTFCENSVIKYLDLSYPYFNAPIASRVTKTVNKACEVIGKVFRENQSIRELHLNGDSERRFGPSLGISLSGLKDNDTLEKLFIKGNAIGDRGALSLSEALKSNRKLKSLDIDENEIGIDGYSAINYVFTSGSNLSVKHFTYPIQDLETYENKRDLSFNPPTIKRMALEKEKRKANLRRVLDEIMDSIKQFNNFDSTNDAFNE